MHKITVKDFPHLNFGDVRRDERFVTIINNISTQPGSSITPLLVCSTAMWDSVPTNYL